MISRVREGDFKHQEEALT